MQTLTFDILIDASREHVWNTMLELETYELWTSVFAPTSTYTGSWEKEGEIRFLDGEGNGMIAEIADNRLHEFISIRHLGSLEDGVENTSVDRSGAYENYTFTEVGGKTNVHVDVDMIEEYIEMFQDLRPKALEELKKLCESR